jgi:hypothetical protein
VWWRWRERFEVGGGHGNFFNNDAVGSGECHCGAAT